MPTLSAAGRHDLADREWSVLEPLLPKGKKAGRLRRHSLRRLLDGIRWRIRAPHGGTWLPGTGPSSHREVDESRSAPGQPWHPHRQELPVPCGVPVLLDVEILPSSTLFRSGERLVLVIAGSDLYPYPDETVALGHTETRNRGKHLVCTGGATTSRLVIPVVPRRRAGS